ncbi:MAG: MFS transporter [Spirochaetales bacterium]|nr:MFS transporter [Spirochaetales bacterium]
MKYQRNNIQVLHLIKFFSTLYFYIQVLTLYLQSYELSYIQINSMWGIIVFIQAVAEVPSGLLADRFGRKKTIIVALFLQLAGELIFLGGSRYIHFMLSAAAGGVGFAFLSGSFEALMYDSLKTQNRENEMQKVAGLNAALGLLASVIGSLAGGYLTSGLQIQRIRWAIIVTAIFVALSWAASFFLVEIKPTQANKPARAATTLKKAFFAITRNRALLKIILLSLLATPFINYLLYLYPPRFVQLGIGGIWLGITLSLGSLAGFFTSKYAHLGEKYLGVRKTVLIATITPGLLYLALSFITNSVATIILVVTAIGAMQLRKPIFLDYVNRHVASDIRATSLSIVSMITGLYVAGMGVLIGVLADYNISYAFVFMGSLIILGALFIRIDKTHTQGTQVD